jgi:transposase
MMRKGIGIPRNSLAMAQRSSMLRRELAKRYGVTEEEILAAVSRGIKEAKRCASNKAKKRKAKANKKRSDNSGSMWSLGASPINTGALHGMKF